MSTTVQVHFEPTPNPQTLKFVANQKLTEEPADFKSATESLRSPLAKKIFGFPWTVAVFIGQDFITVTKQDWVDWDVLAEPLAGLITEHLERGEPIILTAKKSADSPDAGDDSAEVQMIKKILNEEIRPAVAMDGGDIVFHKYENKIVYLHMQGACNGCPSSTATLKMGIESRLRAVLPEIQDVVAM